eukprot:7951124-Alexandrium_andersonii.AAC.1
MSASLVGSEMCIRDSHMHVLYPRGRPHRLMRDGPGEVRELAHECGQTLCLLYTSDAADDM